MQQVLAISVSLLFLKYGLQTHSTHQPIPSLLQSCWCGALCFSSITSLWLAKKASSPGVALSQEVISTQLYPFFYQSGMLDSLGLLTATSVCTSSSNCRGSPAGKARPCFEWSTKLLLGLCQQLINEIIPALPGHQREQAIPAATWNWRTGCIFHQQEWLSLMDLEELLFGDRTVWCTDEALPPSLCLLLPAASST